MPSFESDRHRGEKPEDAGQSNPRASRDASQRSAKMAYLDTRLGRALQLGLLVLAYLAIAPFAVVHLDFARDVYVALRLVGGDEVPFVGPPLAGTHHLGPFWYFALAVPIAMGLGWQGIVVYVALIGALQFPLAYLAGKALHSRAAGMTWAILLMLPAWSTFETLLPGHTQWTATLVLAALVSALRYWQSGRSLYFVLLALSSSLAVHAHPTAAGLAWIGLSAFVIGRRRRQLSIIAIVVASVVALIPFLPILIHEAPDGMRYLNALGLSARDGSLVSALAMAPMTIVQSTVGGLGYWLGTVFSIHPWLVQAARILLIALLLWGAAGLVRGLRDPSFRPLGLAALAAWAAMTLTASVLRPQIPYYMTTTPRVVTLGLAAIGLAFILGPRLRNALATIALAGQGALVVGAGMLLSRGSWPVSVYPLFDVHREVQPHHPLAMLPAFAAGRSGAFLCQGPVVVHGAYALHVLHGYALEARLTCGDVNVLIGGRAEGGRSQWLGLSRQLLHEAGVSSDSRIGPIVLLPVRQVLGDPVSVVSPIQPVYPPIAIASAESEVRILNARLSTGERLAISHLAFPFVPAPRVEVWVNDFHLKPIASDAITELWSCDSCGDVDVIIKVRAADFRHLDVVTF